MTIWISFYNDKKHKWKYKIGGLKTDKSVCNGFLGYDTAML
jgi:hypothetical protein